MVKVREYLLSQDKVLHPQFQIAQIVLDEPVPKPEVVIGQSVEPTPPRAFRIVSHGDTPFDEAKPFQAFEVRADPVGALQPNGRGYLARSRLSMSDGP
ncbi:MAG: hypothetical protein Q8R28_21805 [Dehalococcoidia bacterium]|nr:hypothetical protein [Dehalococcoidia bacterium]